MKAIKRSVWFFAGSCRSSYLAGEMKKMMYKLWLIVIGAVRYWIADCWRTPERLISRWDQRRAVQLNVTNSFLSLNSCLRDVN